MEPLDTKALPNGALLLVDSAPIIYTLETRPKFAARYKPMFARHAAGELLLAVTTITIAEVLTGPLGAGEEDRHGRDSWNEANDENDDRDDDKTYDDPPRMTEPDGNRRQPQSLRVPVAGDKVNSVDVKPVDFTMKS